MESTFPLAAGVTIHEVYDLKGSSHGREIKENEKEAKVVIYKDNDFDRNPDRAFKLESADRERFLAQLERDVDFLERRNLIDYSLLVGISFQGSSDAVVERDARQFVAKSGVREVYYVQLIDYLIKYGAKKMLESSLRGGLVQLKSENRGLEYSALSVTYPAEYAARMKAFIRSKTPVARSRHSRNVTLALSENLSLSEDLCLSEEL